MSAASHIIIPEPVFRPDVAAVGLVSDEEAKALEAKRMQAEADAAVLKAKRAEAAKKAAITRRRNASRVALTDAIRESLRRYFDPTRAVLREGVYGTGHIKFAAECGVAEPKTKDFGPLVKSLLDPKLKGINVQTLRAQVAAAILKQQGVSTPSDAVVTEAIFRCILRLRCEMREPKRPGFAYKASKPDEFIPTFPGFSRPPMRIYRAAGEVSFAIKGVDTPVTLPFDHPQVAKLQAKAAETGKEPDVKQVSSRMVISKRNILLEHALEVENREHRSAWYATTLRPIMDNGKVKPADWFWLMRHSLLFSARPRYEDEVLSAPSPLWQFVKKEFHPSVLMPQVVALTALVGPAAMVPKCLPKTHAAIAIAIGDGSGCAFPAAAMVSKTPEAVMVELDKNPEAKGCATSGVSIFKFGSLCVRDFDTSADCAKAMDEPHVIPFKEYGEKWLGMKDGEAKTYGDEMLIKMRAAVGMVCIELDPSVEPDLCYHIFNHSEELWPKDGDDKDYPRDLGIRVQWASKSCMRDNVNSVNCVRWYAHVSTAKLLVCVNKAGTVLGRSLLHSGYCAKTLQPAHFSDRFYISGKRPAEVMLDHCKANGYKTCQENVMAEFIAPNHYRAILEINGVTPYMDSLAQSHAFKTTSGSGVYASFSLQNKSVPDVLAGLNSPAYREFAELASYKWMPKADAFAAGKDEEYALGRPGADATLSPFSAVKVKEVNTVSAEEVRRFTVLIDGVFRSKLLNATAVADLVAKGYTAWRSARTAQPALLCEAGEAFTVETAGKAERVLKAANPEWHPMAIRIGGKVVTPTPDELEVLRSNGKAGVRSFQPLREVSTKLKAKEVLRTLAFPSSGK